MSWCAIWADYYNFLANQPWNTDVETALKNKLLAVYGYNGMDFGQTIAPQNIEYVLNQLPQIQLVKVTALFEFGGSGLNTVTGSAQVLNINFGYGGAAAATTRTDHAAGDEPGRGDGRDDHEDRDDGQDRFTAHGDPSGSAGRHAHMRRTGKRISPGEG